MWQLLVEKFKGQGCSVRCIAGRTASYYVGTGLTSSLVVIFLVVDLNVVHTKAATSSLVDQYCLALSQPVVAVSRCSKQTYHCAAS